MLKPGIYQHYKGNEYQVIGVAADTETGDELVVYRALYGEHKLWSQPLERFIETIKTDNYSGPRFEWLRPDYS